MLTVMEAVQRRRSIRRFKPEPVPDELISQILEAARLAPSGSNRQPWRFQVIKGQALKERIFNEATFNQRHILEAPVVIACGFELLTFVKGHRLAPPGAEYFGANSEDWDEISKFIPDAQMNTAIAIEHMILTATALGLGSCWVQRIRYGQAAKILGWPRHIPLLAMVPVGYADEEPSPRPRLPLADILLQEGNLPQ